MAAIAPTAPVKSYLAKVTSKGQITIPAEVRQMLALKPGDKR